MSGFTSDFSRFSPSILHAKRNTYLLTGWPLPPHAPVPHHLLPLVHSPSTGDLKGPVNFGMLFNNSFVPILLLANQFSLVGKLDT